MALINFLSSVNDGEFTSEATVTLTINPINDAPTASNEYIELNEKYQCSCLLFNRGY